MVIIPNFRTHRSEEQFDRSTLFIYFLYWKIASYTMKNRLFLLFSRKCWEKNGFHHKIKVWSGCQGLNKPVFFSLSYTNGSSSVSHRPHFQTWISLKPVGQSWSNFMYSIIGMGERLHKVLGQIGSKLWFPWQQKPPLTYNGENNVSTFSRLFLSDPFYTCR